MVNPRAFRDLFPDVPVGELPFRQAVAGERVLLLTEERAQTIPTPPTMRNHGHHTASLSEVVRWLGERAEALGVNILPGFPVSSLLADGSRVVGVRTAPAGLDRSGEPGPRHEPATDVTARCVVLSEGTRGMLTQAYAAWQAGIAEGSSPRLRESYARVCSTLGRDVEVALPDGTTLTGRATGIDEHGRLVVAPAAGPEVAVGAGDVVHVRPA